MKNLKLKKYPILHNENMDQTNSRRNANERGGGPTFVRQLFMLRVDFDLRIILSRTVTQINSARLAT